MVGNCPGVGGRLGAAGSTACVPPLFPDTGDSNCLAGADDTSGRGALVRGGNFLSQTLAGVFLGGWER